MTDPGAIFGAGGLAGILAAVGVIIQALIKRRTVTTDAAAQLSDQALEMIRANREDSQAQITMARQAAEAQIRATEASCAERLAQALADVGSARREAGEARRAAEMAERAAEGWYRRMSMEAYRPSATVDRWRELVDSFPINGSAVR
jgi:multidrug efflux pump subunit AcrA (membrane-fusion protein)